MGVAFSVRRIGARKNADLREDVRTDMSNEIEGSRQAAALRGVPDALRGMLSGRADLADKFQNFQNAYHEEGLLDAHLLELCRARIDVLHGIESETTLDPALAELIARGSFASLAAHEQLALTVAETLAIDAHGVTDEQVSQLNAMLGEAATVTLLTAVSMHDARIRLQQVLTPLIGSPQTKTGKA